MQVTHAKANLLTGTEANRQLEKNEHEMKRQYCEGVKTIDRGVFTLFTVLGFSTQGMGGREGA